MEPAAAVIFSYPWKMQCRRLSIIAVIAIITFTASKLGLNAL